VNILNLFDVVRELIEFRSIEFHQLLYRKEISLNGKGAVDDSIEAKELLICATVGI
jgi:hypothetical protein